MGKRGIVYGFTGRKSKGEMKRKKQVIDNSVTEDHKKSLELKERLLPGIPDEVTLDLITPKLHWKTFHTLSSICSAWQQAIRNHLVYNARVRSHSGESLVLVRTWSGDEKYGSWSSWSYENDFGFALYSLREKTFYRLPPLCHEDGDIFEGSCIALDGKIYVLGGLKRHTPRDPNDPEALSINKVYVLDLAGQRQWKQCASMQNTRAKFGCGAMDGKIYVFGGESSDIHTRIPPISESEVYDPSVNAWSDIEHMPGGLWSGNNVTTAGEELLVYEGYRLKTIDSYGEDQSDLMSYRLVTGEWRTLSKIFGFDGMVGDSWGFTVFVAQGKFYRMLVSRIDVYDGERDSWAELHSFSLPFINWLVEDEVIIEVQPVNNELLAIVSSFGLDFNCVVVSKGFCSGEKGIVWEIAPSSRYISSLVCTLTL